MVGFAILVDPRAPSATSRPSPDAAPDLSAERRTGSNHGTFAVVALHHMPILKPKAESPSSSSQKAFRKIALLDPLDMLPQVFRWDRSLDVLLDILEKSQELSRGNGVGVSNVKSEEPIDEVCIIIEVL
jgi:hypothetical protein